DSVPCKSKASSVPTGSRNSSASVNAGRFDSAASRNRPLVNSAGRHNPAGRIGKAAHHSADQPNLAGWSKRPAPVSAGRPVSAGDPRIDNDLDSVPCKSKAAYVPTDSRNSSASVNAGRSDSAASRNRPIVNSAGRPNPAGRIGKAAHHSADQPYPAGWSKRPAPISAGRPVFAGWFTPAARPYFRPSSAYFNNLYWPEIYDSMYMNEGRCGTAVKPSA
nr:hypothetical protein [Tanacetum cinerariifolium]